MDKLNGFTYVLQHLILSKCLLVACTIVDVKQIPMKLDVQGLLQLPYIWLTCQDCLSWSWQL